MATSYPPGAPPDFVRTIDLQTAYWSPDPGAQAALESRPLDSLSWPERLRLHHLTAMQRLAGDQKSTGSLCRLVQRLCAPDSPYRPRPAVVWQATKAQPPGAQREPDLQGLFSNASFTHLGALEIFHLDAANVPDRLDFVGFDDLADVAFASPSLLRLAKIFRYDGTSEIVSMPLIYGPTWAHGTDNERSGQLTSFRAHFKETNELPPILAPSGIGLGHQDFVLQNPGKGVSLLGLGSIAHLAFPLELADPRFDQKARARGLDPDALRVQSQQQPAP